MITQWGAPGLDPIVTAQIDTLLVEVRQATTNRLLQAATLTYQERVLAAYAARVATLEAFITAQGLQVPQEGEQPAEAPVGPPTGQF